MRLLWCFLHAAVSVTPNIVWFFTDDQDQMLGGSFPIHNKTTPMPHTQALLAEQGVSATNFFAHTPICCPSRSQLLTGRYFHNLKVVGNKGCMHANETLVNDYNFLQILHRDANYNVGMFGKYLNNMPDKVPFGFNAWLANGGGSYLAPSFQVQNVDGFPNGTWQGSADDYTTAVVGNASVAWIRKMATQFPSQPFFAYIAPKSAHEPFNPAPWYADHWDPSWPSQEPRPKNCWNASLASRKDKHGNLATNPLLTEEAADVVTGIFKNRWRTLMSVDDVVEAVIAEVQSLGLMTSTYFFFSSDHGYQLGEFNILLDKRQVYDTNTRIAFLARGPGISPGSNFSYPATMVDVAPTFLTLAGLPKPADMDGKPLVPLFVDSSRFHELLLSTRTYMQSIDQTKYQNSWRDVVFIEYYYNYPFPKCVNDCNQTCGEYPAQDAYCAGLETKPNSLCWGSCCTQQCYATESTANNFIALRSMADSANGDTLYAEFQTGDLTNADIKFEHVDFYEYYNASNDPWQINNVYKSTDKDVLNRLHNQLSQWFACAGDTCP